MTNEIKVYLVQTKSKNNNKLAYKIEAYSIDEVINRINELTRYQEEIILISLVEDEAE